ncbi:D-glycero-beta-D-manno-heptose 1-phosphate adenylyltransferase [Labedella phragmitis]|uniref:Bifunctional protein HldE n=1 Tax=Labedella phragmitis TaxID=2498849 RepID=A0A3S3Z4K9_9MICO|nr:D-glycero-beta-D-manno-heptose 1-phosphate adenylyltransferase [Labedella phragmitis]RWZ51524.1 D-glycero-beta-D-manno-heptose 1-phosphate adenylyltransferase [Labedella phragmitis]
MSDERSGAAATPAGPASEEPTVERLPALIRESAPLVLVVGDLLLDRWWRGGSARLSREAPAPVVDLVDRTDAPGGAANTAMNLAALGARVRLVGAVGDDESGGQLCATLSAAGVDVSGVIRRPGGSTVTKTRIMADDQVLVRVDDGDRGRASAEEEGLLADAIEAAVDGAQALVVCDYGSGVLHGEVGGHLESVVAARPGLLTVVDAHDLARWRSLSPDIVTPNEAEAALLLRHARSWPGVGPDRIASFVAASDDLLTLSAATTVVVTLDRDGTVAIGRDSEPFATLAHPAAEKFASGAGDTFTAALTAAVACGAAMPVATTIAQHAADVVVGRFGTAVCSTSDLEARVSLDGPVAVDAEDLAAIVADERRDGRRVVFTNGCFDVLHRGHTSYLRQAKALGDLLVVAINSDESVRRLKGPERPINPAADRAAVLASLECVDLVTVFETDTPIPLLERLEPDVYVKGGDYSPEMLEETTVVRAYGGDVRIVDYVSAHSTTSMVERIRSRREDPVP